VHQRPGLAGVDARGDVAGAQHRGQAEVPGGQRLAHAHHVGDDARVLGGEPRAGSPEAGGDLVQHQQQPVLVGHLAQDAQAGRRVDVHAAGTLQHGLDDDRGEPPRVQLGQLPDPLGPGHHLGVLGAEVEAAGRAGGEHLLGQDAGEHRVHATHRVAEAHRGEGVPVVAAPDGDQARAAGPAPAALVLQAHLDRDLDRHRPGVAEEGVLQTLGGRGEQPPHQPHRGRVGQPAEHHVAELRRLRPQRLVQPGVAVAVDRRPPRRHPVDHLARAGDPQPDALRALDHARRLRRGRRGVRVPHVPAVEVEQRVHRGACRGAHHRAVDSALTGIRSSRSRARSSAAGRPSVVR
jgi:hypothetical protein